MYSFAVLQHVTEEVLVTLLAEFHRILRADGVALWHILVDNEACSSTASTA